MFLWIFRNFILLASDNDEHNMLMRQKMKTRIRLYIHVKLCLLRGQKSCRGSNTINAWKQNPPKWEKFLTYSSPLKQPRCYLNDLILLSNQNHGRINTSSRYNGGQKNIPLWQVLSKELCYIRILLLITVLFMTGFGFIPLFPLPLPATFQYKQDSFPPTNFFYTCVV